MGTSYTTTRKKHALHNFEVYQHLKSSTEFTDWAITTAFYTALHAVEFYLFPFTDWDDVVYESIQEFHQVTNYSSKHKSRDQLIRARCEDIFTDYRRLSELCWKARYEQFNFSNTERIIEDIDLRLERIFEKFAISI